MLQLIAVLVAVFAGYQCKRLPVSMPVLNRFLGLSIQLILLIMGYEFGSTSANLASELLVLGRIVAIFVGCIFIANFVSVSIVCRKYTRNFSVQHGKQSASLFSYIKSSFKYLIYVICGIIIGYLLSIPLHDLNFIISGLLLCVLFIIGFQLRAQNIALRSILMNKLGLMIALSILFSSIGAGVIAALLSGLGVKTGMVLGSGFGWYTLSGILTTGLINQQMGTAAFFIDFSRELIALVLVPMLGNRYPLQTIGYCGATAMDFSLPIIKETMGENVVPIAITIGMLLSVLVPLLIPIIWQL